MARVVRTPRVMRVALESLDVPVADDVLAAVNRTVAERVALPLFQGVRDVRLRLRHARGALLCIAAVGFNGGDLVTSSATSDSPLEAIVGALDGLPGRMERLHRGGTRTRPPADADHAAVRGALKRLLDRA